MYIRSLRNASTTTWDFLWFFDNPQKISKKVSDKSKTRCPFWEQRVGKSFV
jgi:hypothetical protein